jgi:MoxR-like ATPase
MAVKLTNNEVIDKVKAVLGSSNSIEVNASDPALGGAGAYLHIVKVALALSKAGICVKRHQDGETFTIFRAGSAPTTSTKVTTAPKTTDKPTTAKAPKVDRTKHSSRPYAKEQDILDIMADDVSHVMMFTGPTGCGKTFEAKRLANLTGRVLYRMNCHGEQTEKDVFGEKTVVLNETTGSIQTFIDQLDFTYLDKVKLSWLKPVFYMLAQFVRLLLGGTNHVVFKPGTLVQAMLEGLDEDGNEVGPAALLLIDEFAAMPSHLSIALNSFFESDDPRRRLVIEADGGRVIKSHSGLRVIVTGNTAGRGATTMQEAMYSAQQDAQDLSVLNRVAVVFRFGYDKKLEKGILMEKVGDDKVVRIILRLREQLRGHIKNGTLTSPFGTRHLIYIADCYRVWGDLGKALYATIMGRLGPEERAVYNETFHAITSRDLLKEFEDSTGSDIDYM